MYGIYSSTLFDRQVLLFALIPILIFMLRISCECNYLHWHLLSSPFI